MRGQVGPLDQYPETRAPWTADHLARLFADYFGDKLSPAELERLVSDVAAALADRLAAGATPWFGLRVRTAARTHLRG